MNSYDSPAMVTALETYPQTATELSKSKMAGCEIGADKANYR